MDKNQTIREILINLQRKSSKDIKEEMYKLLPEILDNSNFDSNAIEYIFEGEEDLSGLCELSGLKNGRDELKKSSKKTLIMVNRLLLYTNKKEYFKQVFVELDNSSLEKMKLGDHFYSHYKLNNKNRDIQISLEIVKIILDKRPFFDLNEIILDTAIIDIMKENFKLNVKMKKVFQKKAFKFFGSFILNISRECNFREPSSWDEVSKIDKKLLTVNFIVNKTKTGMDNIVISEEKQILQNFLNNFIDPLTTNQRVINFGSFDEADRKKLHLQSEEFDTIYFYEKFYSQHTIRQMTNCLEILKCHQATLNLNEETLLDKNIYKYLDCKKILDELFSNFNTNTSEILQDLKQTMITSQKNMLECISLLKKGFEQILKSKVSKEIIGKFSRLFTIKEDLQDLLRMSDFEALAQYIKKIRNVVDSISQTTFIYGQFYEDFLTKNENIKSILINIIKNSITPLVIISNFKYILDFDVDGDIIDDLYLDLKEKLCSKLKKYLTYSIKCETINIKEFFCDEHIICFKNEEYFSDIYRESENYLKAQETLDLDGEEVISEKKELIDPDLVIKTCLKELRDYFAMFKRIESIVSNKKFYLPRNFGFHIIIEQIYKFIFSELNEFLFTFDFKFNIVKENYLKRSKFIKEEIINTEMNKLFEFYENGKNSVVFNQRLDRKKLNNIFESIIDIVNVFEQNLTPENINHLKESKKELMERIFTSFINEEYFINFPLLENRKTINCYNSSITISNSSFLSYSFNYLKKLKSKYNEFNMVFINIENKVRDIKLDFNLLILHFFFIIKFFVLKFIEFYENDLCKLDCKEKQNYLALEMIKNNFSLTNEIIILTKSLFKCRKIDLTIFFSEFNSFCSKIHEYFYDIYLKNTANLMFNTILKSEDITRYGLYNITVLEKNFYELRSYVIDILLLIVDVVKSLYTFEKRKLIKNIVERIISSFFILFKDYLTVNLNDKLRGSKLLAFQFIIEIEFLSSSLEKYLCSSSMETKNKILALLYEHKSYNMNNNSEDIVSVTNKEKDLKNEKKLSSDEQAKIIEIVKKYRENYSFYIKSFDLQI